MSTMSSKFFAVAKTVGVWYFCQIMASIVNKKILTNASENVLPMTLSFLNLLVAAVLDFLCLQYVFPNRGSVKALVENIRAKIHIMYPMVLSMILSKYFSLLAYSLISIALMQTIKATSPFALVVLSKLWLNKTYPVSVYMSLIPILLGAMLAASGDYEFNIVGAVAAFTATCLGAYNRLYIKRHILSNGQSQLSNLKGSGQSLNSLKTTILGHFELAACATLLVFPISLVQEMVYYGKHSFPFAKIFFLWAPSGRKKKLHPVKIVMAKKIPPGRPANRPVHPSSYREILFHGSLLVAKKKSKWPFWRCQACNPCSLAHIYHI